MQPYPLWIDMEATAYLPTDGSGDGITATGIPAHYGVVAVDPHAAYRIRRTGSYNNN